ncbi:DUF4998 domain-containing protein [Sphingobacterium phlebotomi]|uniref:DUF4998 domain-containing protein n=1 Tax=Sphingobacterium phlebotomi TaxID=2605433 RepID=A0A5D4HCU3_9SPHI|nr:DUF4998 domain-containing protein [Sphingobacterium phlebotomi]TYR36620.1 DUF4998 domain-containing protein [Sphingobacterium phlebotomi]
MKNIIKLFAQAWYLPVLLLLALTSCDKMNDIQQEFAGREERSYLGKVDSIEYYPGFGRAKLTWYVSADPKVERTIIYWNMRQDSVVKEFVRNTSGIQKDSITLDDLPEGSTLFEFRNVNSRGESSLYSSATVTVWGLEFGDGLRARRVQAFDLDYEQSIYNLMLSPSSAGDSVLFSEIVYTNDLGVEKTVEIKPEINEVALNNFSAGNEFRFRTVFFLPEGIDTVYNGFQVYRAATAVSERGTKISLQGKSGSKYFDNYGTLLYEWNTAGDLITYDADTNGELTQTESYPAIAPRSTYRDFFFYDDNKFIGVLTNNRVTMQQLEDGALSVVGAATFGSGFSHIQYLPTRGFFFSRSAAGALNTWIARNDATWGTPNGASVGTGYNAYGEIMLYNHEAILAVDQNGYLWNIPISVSGVPGFKSRIGRGWDRFEKIVSVGTTLYGMESNGDFYVFNDFNTTETFWIVD